MQTKAREKQSELIFGQLVNFTAWIVFDLLIQDLWKGVRILYKQLLVQFNLALTEPMTCFSIFRVGLSIFYTTFCKIT